MTCHISRALDKLFLLRIVQQTIVEGMRRFGFARDCGRLVAWQCTPAFVIERDGWGEIEIL